MLEPLLMSTNAERVLVFIEARGKGYAREIARFFNCEPDSIQKQLVKFEENGLLISWTEGRTRLYEFNPRYPFLSELKVLLQKAISFYRDEERKRLLMNRRRPRKRGKPL